MATSTSTSTSTSADIAAVILALAPAAYFKEEGIDAPKRSERVAARRVIAHLWCDIDAGRPCAAASFTMRMSDGSTFPFRLWAETVLGIREAGRTYAIGTV
jgi:hypothetical protein